MTRGPGLRRRPSNGAWMRDFEIRRVLLRQLREQFERDPETLIVSELGIERGASRADVAVVNGVLHGFEIKSERDTLLRLPAQVDAYGRVFDQLTIVAGQRHLERVLELVPTWWGVTVPRMRRVLELDDVRPAGLNPQPDPRAIAELLWRDEAEDILAQRELVRGLRGRPRRELSEKLAETLPLDDLRREVRDRLRARRDWRAA